MVHFMFLGMLLVLFNACASKNYIIPQGVAYRSIHATNGTTIESEIPDTAKIIVKCWLDPMKNHTGRVSVFIQNNTDEVMVIDKAKSFFRNADGISQMYWDTEVKTHTTSSTTGGSKGLSVNLGSLTGIGMLSGVNVGGGTSSANTNTNTTYDIDQQMISIAPHSGKNIGRYFYVDAERFCYQFPSVIAEQKNAFTMMSFTPKNSSLNFGVSITYSLDNGQTFDRIDNDFYANSLIVSRPRQEGQFNEAVREIYVRKQDALQEPWYQLFFYSKHPKDEKTSMSSTFVQIMWQFNELYKNNEWYHTCTFFNYK